MMKVIPLINKLIKKFFILSLIFIIFYSNSLNALDFQMSKIEDKIVEELRIKVPAKYKETWLKAEKEVWDKWLSKQDGFLGRKIFYDENREEALLLVNWQNRNLWKNISNEEVNKIQRIYEETIKNSLGIQKYPFEFIYEGELLEQK